MKLGKILIKKVVKCYTTAAGSPIEEVVETLSLNGKIIALQDEGDISLTDGLKALGLEHTTEFTLENN